MGKPENNSTLMQAGLLVMRVGIGAMFILHGWPKITGGPETWARLGQAMGMLGITFAYSFWGFMAAFAEFVGGIALVLGLFTRFFALLMFITMLIASVMHLRKGEGIMSASHAIKMAIVFLGLLCTGAGAFSIGALMNRGCTKK